MGCVKSSLVFELELGGMPVLNKDFESVHIDQKKKKKNNNNKNAYMPASFDARLAIPTAQITTQFDKWYWKCRSSAALIKYIQFRQQ